MLHKTQGHLVYALDDAYIHMAMAKNGALHGIWGVTRHGFTSSTSSPLWTLLLLITYVVFGVSEVSPFVLNVLFSTAAVVVSYLVISKQMASRLGVFAACLLVLFLTPLPTLTFVGMEHVLHAVLTLSFVYLSARVLSSDPGVPRNSLPLLAFLAPLLVATRYEGAFVVFVVCILLILKKRGLLAGAIGTAALLPVVAYGIWSLSQGWYFLPNSLLLKTPAPDLTIRGIFNAILGSRLWTHASTFPDVVCLLIAALLLLLCYPRRKAGWDATKYALAIFVGAAVLHLESIENVVWFYRYEAYLVLLGTVVIAAAAGHPCPGKAAWRISWKALPRYAAVALLVTHLAGPLVLRAIKSLRVTPQATKNLFDQQYQMGLFLNTYYRNKPVAVNDIGAVAFLADARLLDLFGLGSMAPARLKRQHLYGSQHLDSLAREEGVVVAVVPPGWYSNRKWREVGLWRIANNVVNVDSTVSICAVDSSAVEELVENLRAFADQLPKDVKQLGAYTER
ncbi:hypothetical protein FJY68_14295 [candidate division WOR-3 bacterium]|uniref:Uncharacterized protein n=1 Tax=candidate division WOR-3 bacterium TaxID=2052148 RepID=A0A937XK07_UNCW3|nr:hypothetical protein [candidate division WOR-3 bacterium]